MHIILLAVLALIVIFFLLNQSKQQQKETGELVNDGDDKAEFDKKIAFISKGKLFYRDKEGQVHQLQSPYVQEMIDRMERNKQRHGWKEGTSFGTSFTSRSQQKVSSEISIQVVSAQFCGPDKLIYFLVDESFGGLFEYDLNTKEEKRLLHKQNLKLDGLEVNQQQSQLLGSQASASGVANIVTMSIDGSDTRELTGGDTVDASPAWVSENETQILFESYGLARDEGGFVIAHGPSSIQLLDVDSGELTSVLENDNFDFFSPKVCSHGQLYFIRRPYETPKYSSSSFLSDFLLFPFRLIRAVFHYLNFFSLMYSRKPLTSASGPKVQAELKDILIKGKRIDAENALRKEASVQGVPSLVPKSWELVCRNQQGEESVVATNVAAFNITSSEQIVYSNGYGVFLIGNNNRNTVIFKDKLIADLIVN